MNQGHDEKYIDLKSIIRGSLVGRVLQNNQRIKNQQGAFIIINANISENEKMTLLEKNFLNIQLNQKHSQIKKTKWKNDFKCLETGNSYLKR